MKKILMGTAAIVAGGVLLSGCSMNGKMVKPETVSQKTWVLTSMNGMPVTESGRVTLNMKPLSTYEGSIAGQGPCNRYFGKYRVENDELLFTSMGSTMMACSIAAMQQEKTFISGLKKTNHMVMKDGVLVLKNREGSVSYGFSRESARITGRIESSSGGFPAGSKISVLIQEAKTKNPRAAIGDETIVLKDAVLGSIPFTVNYAPELVKKDRTYNVNVSVMNKGKLIYTGKMNNVVNVNHPINLKASEVKS
ncbi:META domain-containing protein [Candidatus Sororendozoicomonas aggregata]|uniref:META domain-containing protein n=1 Tax=Candidatus Sororendozoicomonas aggregata TaxID=3073239 RepID=UPI002ED58B4C